MGIPRGRGVVKAKGKYEANKLEFLEGREVQTKTKPSVEVGGGGGVYSGTACAYIQ